MTSAASSTNWAGSAGNAALGFVGHWTGRGLVQAFRHPIHSGMALALTLGIGFGATNALFMQTVRHPAPLFMDTASIASPIEAAQGGTAVVARQPMPTSLPRPLDIVTTPSAPANVTIPDKVGNRDVAELQARLMELGYFAGRVDGYYGPRTADAIRRFETDAGLKPVGAVTPEVLSAAKAYIPATIPQPVTQAIATPAVVTAPVAAAAQAVAQPVDDPIGRIAASVSDVAIAAPAPLVQQPEPAKKKPSVLDPELVRMVQTGLGRLGFLHAEITGKFDNETARAIREFENYNNFQVTGELSPDLLDVLMAAGAFN